MIPPRPSVWLPALLLLAILSPAARAAGLFVSSVHTASVLEYDGTTGAFVKTFASGGGLNGPFGLVFGPNGDLFVSSSNTDAVLEYDGTTGAFVKSFVSPRQRRAGFSHRPGVRSQRRPVRQQLRRPPTLCWDN